MSQPSRELRLLPRVLLLIGLGAYSLCFGWLLHLRHTRFCTTDFDLGIFDQNLWLLAHGRSFLTTRGLEVFGHHASFGHLLLVPFYWMGAGPEFLDNAMVAAVAAAAVVVFRIAARLSGSEWIALVLAMAFAWQPTTTWLLQESYHPEVMAIPALFAAFDAGQQRRWRAYGLWLVLAVSFKEDVALAAAMLGAVAAVRGHRRAGLATAAASLVYFVLVVEVLIPHYAPEGAFFQQFYSHLGSTPGAVVETALTAPQRILYQLGKSGAWAYARDMTVGYGFSPLLSPVPLLVGLPQFAANLLSQHSFTWNTHLHYAALVLAAATLAMVEGVCRRRRARNRWLLAMLVAACAATTTLTRGIGPGSAEFRSGYWPLVDNLRYATLARAVALPGPDDAVAATYNLVPHLTHRQRIYRFPNPWWISDWGVRGENTHDPERVDWLVL
ncbi:MAG: DUF2079 domain-containing protein, partial [Deltaproteobacteria bacterium]|nr:DUF2079 domain-containing protein [Deltaproteobacteria bacterium]